MEMNERRDKETPPIIRGSWEDLYQQGQRKAAEHPEEAIPLFLRVFNGLGRLPKSSRLAADGRLQDLYDRSALSLNAALNLEGRYDESLEVLAQARNTVDRNDQSFWNHMIIAVLVANNRLDEAHSRLRQLQDDGQMEGVEQWEPLVEAYIAAGKISEASTTIDELQQWVDDKYSSESQDGAGAEPMADDRLSDTCHVAWLRGLVAVASQEWEGALQRFEEVIELRGPQTGSLNFAYSDFVAHERYSEANALIRKDTKYPIRSGFWRGLVAAAQGHDKAARDSWKRVLKLNVYEELMSLPEYTLAAYHLGDADDSGLDMIEWIVEQMPAAPWQFYCLAGIGWAMRGDMAAARADLRVALNMSKSMALGSLLPYRYWLMSRGLPFDESDLEELRGYFKPAPQPLVDVS